MVHSIKISTSPKLVSTYQCIASKLSVHSSNLSLPLDHSQGPAGDEVLLFPSLPESQGESAAAAAGSFPLLQRRLSAVLPAGSESSAQWGVDDTAHSHP